MQGIHEGTEAMLLPTLLAAVPSIPALLYVPQPKSSSMYLMHCHALPPPSASCFSEYPLDTQKQLYSKCSLRQREVISN